MAPSCPIGDRRDPTHYRSSEMTNSDAPRIHLGPATAPDWLAAAVVAGGARTRRRGRRRGDRVGRRPKRRHAGVDPRRRRGRANPLGAAAVRRHRELRRPPRRRSRLDLRQGRVRRTRRRDGARTRRGRSAQPRQVCRERRSGPGRPAATCSAATSPFSEVVGSRRRWFDSCSRWTARSRSFAATSRPMPGVDDVLEADRFADALARRRPRGAGVGAHPRDRGHVQCRRVRPDAGPRLDRQRRPWPPHRHRRSGRRAAQRRHRRCRPRRHATPNRSPPVIRCGRCRTASSRRTSATRPRWPSRCSRPA